MHPEQNIQCIIHAEVNVSHTSWVLVCNEIKYTAKKNKSVAMVRLARLQNITETVLGAQKFVLNKL